MKPGSTCNSNVRGEKLVIEGRHLKNKEEIEIEIEKIYFLNSHPLEDGQEIEIKGTEEDMAEMLYENPEMLEPGFKPFSREEQTKYGFADLLGVDSEGRIVVVECKRYCAELSAVTQLRRYVEKIASSKGISKEKVRGILAAPKITANAERMLKDWGFGFVAVSPPKYFESEKAKQKTLERF